MLPTATGEGVACASSAPLCRAAVRRWWWQLNHGGEGSYWEFAPSSSQEEEDKFEPSSEGPEAGTADAPTVASHTATAAASDGPIKGAAVVPQVAGGAFLSTEPVEQIRMGRPRRATLRL